MKTPRTAGTGMKTSSIGSWIAAALVVCMVYSPARAADSADAALAMVFEEMALRSLATRSAPGKEDFERCVALLAAARRCDPSEARYPRLQADALVKLGDATRAIEAVNAFRKLRPEDQRSQLELIGLYIDQMQNVDQRIAYYRDILAREAVPREVRAVVAMRCAAAVAEKGKKEEAAGFAEQALKLDPLNWDALWWQYLGTRQTASAAQRTALMVAMVRSNPAQDGVLLAMAEELAHDGLVSESLAWFDYAGRVAMASRTMPAPNLPIDYTSELVLADKLDAAKQFLDMLLQGNPQDFDSLVLRYLVEKRTNEKGAEPVLARARNAAVNVLESSRSKMGIKGATTRPVDDASKALPDVSGDAEAFNKELDGNVKHSYLQWLASLAWFEAYFDKRPEEAEKLLRVYVSLAPPKDPAAEQFAARVQGWIFIDRGDFEGAKVKLRAAATDPMARLGLVKLEPEKEKAKAIAQKLLQDEPMGVIGAVISEAVRELGAKVGPGPDAGGVRTAMAALPNDWMNVLIEPRRFYSLRAEPLKVTYVVGEPMLVKVTVQNIGPYDLTVGPSGVIHPTLWFDAQLSEGFIGMLASAAILDLSQELVLRPRQSMTQVLRFDQGELGAGLMQRLDRPIAVMGIVKSNVVLVDAKTTVPGPAGYQAEFSKVMERVGLTLNDDLLKRMVASSRNGNGAARVRSLGTLAVMAIALRAPGNGEQGAKALSTVLDAIRACEQDADASIKSYAAFAYASGAAEADAGLAVQRMLLPEAPWQERILGIASVGRLPVEKQKMLVDEAAKDPDPTVKMLASASAAVLRRPPATQPAKDEAGK
jgi:tetratricopeptide (TPR) repeat protein